VYLCTLAPTVVFVDSGELILAAKSLGVAHPPGFPLYVLLAHLATRLPFANVAVRVNFASALFAALAVAFLFLLVAEVLSAGPAPITSHKLKNVRSKKKETQREAEPEHTGLWVLINQLLPAVMAALMFAFSRTLWSFATVAEVYTLNTLLLVLIFYLLFRWRNCWQTNDDTRSQGANRIATSSVLPVSRSLFPAAFLFGLALGVHHVSVAVALPALALLVYRTAGWQFFKSRQFVFTGLISLAGFALVYMYLPLAASRSPLMNWGDPRTFERFWWHVSGRQYQVFLSSSPEQIAHQAVEFLKLAAHEFGHGWLPAGFVLAGLGLFDLFRRDRTAFWFLVLIVVCDLGFALNYEIAEDKGAYYLPAFIGLTIAAGIGAYLFLRMFAGKWPSAPGPAPASALILLVPLATFAANFSFSNRHNFFLASDYVNKIESTIAPGGMLLTSDWQVYSPLLYFREVEQQRRDVIGIDISLLRRSWYFDYLKTQYPDLIAANRAQVETFLADLRRWEHDPEEYKKSNALTKQINDHFFEMILAFVSTQMRRAQVYVTWEIGLGVTEDVELSQSLNRDYQLVPQGLVFQLSRDRNFQKPASPQLETRGLTTFKFEPDDVVMVKVLPVYANMLINRGRYLAAYGRYEEAVASYKQALDLAPNFQPALDAWAETLEEMRSKN